MRSAKAQSWFAILALAGASAGIVAAAVTVDDTIAVRAEKQVSVGPAAQSEIDRHFEEAWQANQVSPAELADDLIVLRRASLALHGTVPSLEEIRIYEADERPDRLRIRIRAMLDDSRFADYFAERLARPWVGVSTDPFLIYRRDRFTRWLAKELRENRPYDAIARAVLSTDGLWTSEPAANFVTSAVANDDLDENVLTARTVRGFLGQRIDCAQCHDHPFANWKQTEFQGLAAFFGQSAVSFQGVVDQPRMFENALEYKIENPETKAEQVIAPGVPFLKECLPVDGSRRDRLAAWITDPRNERFSRAAVNRVWGLMFGRPYIAPVDDLPDPGDVSTVLLDRLGAAFRDSGYDLRWLIETIILSRPFRASSSLDGADDDEYQKAAEHWAVFPMTRLRPEQVIGAMIQAGRLQTIDQNSNLLARSIRFFREQDFVGEYGDVGEAELDARSGTVSQALLRMNGKLTRELFEAGPFSAAGRLANLTENDSRLVELCFLVTLARRPTREEHQHFLTLVEGTQKESQARATEDMLWSLVNSAEFSWNH
ncbi:MAG: DUF1549 domain-containing protein [Planctomycetaceae bacterium]|nr:DUF1549 domain-containing protein [Planctomycetaceae bacterium]